MEVQNNARAYDFVEVAASQGDDDSGAGHHTWNPVRPQKLLGDAYKAADAWFATTVSGGADGETFELATAILGKDAVDRVVAQSARNKQVLEGLVALEVMIMDAIKGDASSEFKRPGIDFKSMDDDLNGYFMPGEPDETGEVGPGKIWLSHDLKTWDADARAEVVLEELGEALADHLETALPDVLAPYFEIDPDNVPGEGDVGYRLMKVFTGQPLLPEDFIAKPGDTARVYTGEGEEDEVPTSQEEPELEIDVPENTRTPAELAAEWGVSEDRVTDMIPLAETITDGPPWTAESFAEVEGWDLVVGAYGTDGVVSFNNLLRAFVEEAVYLGQSGSNPDNPGRGDPGVVPENLPDLELAAEWGRPLLEVTAARATAEEIYARKGFTGDQGFTLGDHDSVGWDQMIKIYGLDAATDTADPVLQVDELARAIAEGAFTTTVNSAGETTFDSVDLTRVSNTTIVDATWAYVERNTSDGAERTDITAAHLQEASDYIVGPVMGTDVLTSDGEEPPVEPLSIFGQEHYGLVEGLFADQPSDNGTVDRFSKEAVQTIWDTGVFLQSKDFPADSGLHPIPGFGEIGYALSEENAAIVDGDGEIPDTDIPENPIPDHHHTHWWDTVLGFAEDEAKDVVSTMADIMGKEEEVVADLLNGRLTVAEAIEQGLHIGMDEVKDAIGRADERAVAIVDTIGNSIKTAVTHLGQDAADLVNQLVDDAKSFGEEVAIDLLVTMSGMSKDDVGAMLERIAEIKTMKDLSSSMTLGDAEALIPEYEELEAEAMIVKESMIASEADGVLTLDEATDIVGGDENQALRLISAEGFSVNASGDVLAQNAAGEEEAADDRSFYDKYMRIDVAHDVEFSAADGMGTSSVFNQFKGTRMITMPRQDEAGNTYVEIRLREKDMVGAVEKFSSQLEGKAGIFGTHELVIPIYTDVVDESAKNGVMWRSTVGAQAKGSMDSMATANGFMELIGQTANLGAGDASFDWSQVTSAAGSGRKVAEELGAGAGFATTYALEEFGEDWWKPLLYEGLGALAGATASVVGLGIAEVFSDGAATEFTEEHGLSVVHTGAMLGIVAADLIMADMYGDDRDAEEPDMITQNAGAFGFLNLTWTQYKSAIAPGEKIANKFRIQANIGNKPAVGE